jgi:hypothetical protein
MATMDFTTKPQTLIGQIFSKKAINAESKQASEPLIVHEYCLFW